MTRTHYEELHVTPDAPHKVIKAAYRVLSQQYHPDRMADSDDGERMRRINAAWSVLSNAQARSTYDDALKKMYTEEADAPKEAPVQHETTRARDGWQEPVNVHVPPWLMLLIVVIGLMIVTATLSTKQA